MPLDTATQKKQMFKQVTLEKVRYSRMTGDSIANGFAIENNLSNYLFRKNAVSYLINNSFGGSAVANYGSGVWDPHSFVSKSSDTSPNKFTVTNTDVLLVFAGYNDWVNDVPIGAAGSSNSSEFCGAINNGIVNYLSRNSAIKVMFITVNNNPYKGNNGLGLSLNDYRNGAIAACANSNVPCFDLYPEGVSGITDANKATALPDQTHPAAAWHQMWAPLFAGFVLENI